jgi:hypothetical protein
MTYSNKKSSNDIQSVIVSIANGIVSGEVDTLEGCRQIVGLHYQLNELKEIFLPLMGIVSETDDFPTADQRDLWAPEALLTMDQEKERYLQEVDAIVTSTCNLIISTLSQK